MRIDDIKPYERNARHNDKAVPAVAESIKEFGLRGQIVLESRENPVIVAGHTRWAACRSLGWTEIPDDKIDFCDGLSPEQIKAFRLADNKTGEVATWNVALLKTEAAQLGDKIDMSRFSFDFKSKVRPYGSERLRTDDAYNLRLVNASHCGRSGMPTLKGCMAKPKSMIGFNCAKTAKGFDCAVHFFVDDYQFERVWSSPEKYVDLLKRFECVLTPDFSLYMDMPLPMQRWNEYRRRALGNWWQRNGIKVVPTLSWAGPDSYAFCFEGVPRRSTVAVSTVGVKGDEDALAVWRAGMSEAMVRLRPKRVLIYGGEVGFDFGSCEVVRYKNSVTDRMANGR
ncbi:DUF4417 domain-containing protein [Eggerthella lenta]|uniref:DUF4417 domain-containing protein n=1 Tax=Eggerthella lenta TaxID=84112 RepID=UPI0022E7CB5C|nr:DUF4417 domain-containing protein [Eggerthella lenta]